MEYAVYLLTGVVAGLLAGLLGVGGGVIIVPSLVFLFTLQGFHPEVLVHMAIGTSLATILFTGSSSVLTHHKAGKINWFLVWRLCGGVLIGSFAGGLLADVIAGVYLKFLFGAFALFVAVQMWFDLIPEEKSVLPGGPALFCFGGGIGLGSALLGIGGGTLTIPTLVWHGVKIQSAVAVSAACGLFIAVAGASGFILAGMDEVLLPNLSFGYVYLPAFFGIIVSSIPCAVIGANLSHKVSTTTLKKVFAIVLLVSGSLFVWQLFEAVFLEGLN